MKNVYDEILNGVYSDTTFSTMLKEMPDDEKKIIDQELQKFVKLFAAPLLEQFCVLADSPEAIEEFKKALAKQVQSVVNKHGTAR